jgi:glyoxylase-like metal-dependent hydrolase (beta-lactamase superfamily II)
MDDATVVHPGHGESTTIARERATNPFLRMAAEAGAAQRPRTGPERPRAGTTGL